ncbi:MAG: glycerophosphodiester phosphodiesterase family protein [Marinosulfonomonas sp.]
MRPISLVLSDFRAAWKLRQALIAIHVVILVLLSAIFVPVIGLVLQLVLSFSGQAALTDQDIARFLLTPVGFIGGLGVVSLVITAAVLDVAMMAIAFVRHHQDPITTLRISLGFLARNLPKMIAFSLALMLRILLILLPFAIAAGAIAYVLLDEFDINYYLTVHPPEFVRAAALGAVLGLGLAAVLLSKLASWVIALPLALVQGKTINQAFRESAKLMAGQRLKVIAQLVVWALLRGLAMLAVAFVFGGLIAVVPDLLGSNLRVTVTLSLTFLAIWTIVGAIWTAITAGALTRLIMRIFQASTKHEFAGDAISRNRAALKISTPIWLGAACALIIGGFVVGGNVLSKIGEDQTVEIIAHRGAAGAKPENTMAAVNKAIEDKTDWVEIDVQETADDAIVVAHDSDFMKTAGNPLKVWDATLPDLAKIDIGSWYGPEYSDERTPLLRDVLLAAKGKAKVLIELKYYGHDKDLENHVAALVEETGMTDSIAIMSLKYGAVQKMQKIRPGWTTGVLAATAVGNLSGLDADFLAVNTGQVSLNLIKKAHDSGKKVYAWTVNDPLTMSRMISMGVDGLITDEPALARHVIAQRNELNTGQKFLLWLVDRFDIGNLTRVADPSDA